MQTADEITDLSTIIYNESLITEIVKRDDEITRQAIKDYFKQKYPKENLRFYFLDEEIINQVLELGIAEYQRRQASGGVLNGKQYRKRYSKNSKIDNNKI